MGSTSCSQCGGQFKAETLGRLRDKVLKCPYCGHTCDVPDEYEVTREEVHEDGPGHVRRIRVTERRSDAPGQAMPVMPEAFRGADGKVDPKAVFEDLKKRGLVPADAEFKPDSKGHFTFTTSTSKVTSQVAGNVQDAMSQLQNMMGPGFNVSASMAPPGGAGKSFSRTEERSEQYSGPMSGNQAPAAIKWLVLLGVVILLIILALKLL